jgi:type II secretory pathway component GspD/PulD (secretin)
MIRSYVIVALVISVLVFPTEFSFAQRGKAVGGRMVICVIRLEHADAEHLASILTPFLSPEGSIVAYARTNTLIVKDREPIVNMLAKVIKGKPCTPVSEPQNRKHP